MPHIESPDTVIVRPATASLTVAEFLDLALDSGRGACADDSHSGLCGNAAYYLEYLQARCAQFLLKPRVRCRQHIA